MRIRKLAMLLSKLEPHPCLDVELEQYSTDGNLAARWLTDIAAFGDLPEGCIIADLGAGNGILGIGALTLGASKTIFVESDEQACNITKLNLKNHGFEDVGEVIQSSIGDDEQYLEGVDLIITNPPWGKQIPKADRPFLQSIITSGKTAHLLHSANAVHIEPFFIAAGWRAEKYGEADFALPAKYAHHSRQRDKTRVGFWRITRN